MTHIAPERVRARLGVDIGGTFTDVVATADTGELLYVGKLPSDSAASAMLGGIAVALQATGLHPDQVDIVVHATTLGANALLQSAGARTALVTTRGFRDVLELARGRRPSLYDMQFEKLQPLVPRDRRLEVDERVRHDGGVERPLDEDSVRELLAVLLEMGVQSVAVCLLHSYANPAHEVRVTELLREGLPGVRVVASHEILPEMKEFERTTTTVICAYLAPLLQTYLEEVEAGLDALGVSGRLFVMHSGGGLLRTEDVALRAHTLVESGPAAGVLAASHLIRTQLAEAERAASFVSFDMGGTTAKACIIRDGQFAVTNEYEVGRGAHESFSVKLSGYPIKSPVIDLIESGQGGGSIAWVDSTGVLMVGPVSAGAIPGPACYGRGGELPTVTDCNLVLGRLNPDNFAGGTMKLGPERARHAIEEHLCSRLGTGLEETAAAVLRVVNAAMARSIRVISVQRGIDPRSLTMIAFGGAGPLHATELGIARVLVPPEPGVFSAAGLVRSNPRMDFSQACELPCAPEGEARIRSTFEDLRLRCQSWIESARDVGQEAAISFQADMRYRGQSHTVSVVIDPAWVPGGLPEGLAGAAHRAFDDAHRELYSFDYAGSPAEVVVCRATGSLLIEAGAALGGSSRLTFAGPAPDYQRTVYFPGRGHLPTLIVDRLRLRPGDELVGPAIVEEQTSAFLIPPGRRCRVGTAGILDLDLQAEGGA